MSAGGNGWVIMWLALRSCYDHQRFGEKKGTIAMQGWKDVVMGSLFLAVISTLGDWIWEMWLRHEVYWGVLHGVILCLCIGMVLARSAGGGRAWKWGLIWEPVVGLAAAGVFYLTYSWLSWSAMFLAWMLLWLFTSLLYGYLLSQRPSLKESSLRGVVAAIASGLAFWAISGIWLSPPPDGPNYPWNLCAWTIAFAPGLAALFLRKS